MDKIKAIEAFVRVVDTGGFTKAAESLHTPKATISTLIQDLEAQLGVRLLHRTTRRVTVTADGAAYYERCIRILDDLREADESLSSRHREPKGTLKVDMTTSMASMLMQDHLPAFLRRYPRIDLQLGCTDRPINMVSEGVDCVVRVGEVNDPSLVARRIGSMHFVTCVAPSYLAEHGTPQHPQDLLQHRWISYFVQGRIHHWEFIKGEERLELQLPGGLALNDSNVYRDACLAGVGIGQIPSYAFQCYERQGKLVRILADWGTDALPVHVLYPSNRHLSTKVQVFVEWAAEVFENTPGLRRV
ncbi:MAG: LysR family transcriptional regulator [Aquabacterium sp.]|uniref:LysR substrate-binding domain-containing protein n=1 Tax=Aquabacterium sp. TaxID=1872578 RepID=UPI001216DE3F|nr:LysR family transcriptional regulator [Aquabacterium sp.]TAK99170.1 MAG: LysR family transcriptional regulator [Aquabacterium sp.]